VENDAIRQKIVEEVQAEFDAQMRELKRQKNRVEEELEQATDKFRAERRRLNAEIDNLEAELSTAKRSGGGSGDSEVIEKLRQASGQWQAERERLMTQISSLEGSLADTIARSSNPLRASQAIKDEYEKKVIEATKLRLDLEHELLRARMAWDEDKKKLMSELMRLRKYSTGNPYQEKEEVMRLYGRTGTIEEARIKELESQLGEARASILKYHESAIQSSDELAVAKEEVRRLKNTVAELRSEMGSEDMEHLRREYEARIQDLMQEKAGEPGGNARSQDSGSPAVRQAVKLRLDAAANADIDSEIERIESAIKIIGKILDDPDTPASAIAEKMVEKEKLESYLSGISFAVGRAR